MNSAIRSYSDALLAELDQYAERVSADKETSELLKSAAEHIRDFRQAMRLTAYLMDYDEQAIRKVVHHYLADKICTERADIEAGF